MNVTTDYGILVSTENLLTSSVLKMDFLSRARVYAIEAHNRINHRRKYSLEPYDVHLKDVVEILLTVTDDEEIIAAAWLHDIVEDTPATFLDLEKEFGPQVAQLVSEVTDVSVPANGNRATRKALDRAHLAKASWRGKTIKLADLIDNCRDICSHDPEFAKVYLTEMSGLLEVLSAGHPVLFNKAMELMHKNAEALSLPLEVITAFEGIKRTDKSEFFIHDHVSDMFLRTFKARDIARMLPSMDFPLSETTPALMETQKVPVLGVRRDGLIRTYVIQDDPQQERKFRSGQLVSEEASFGEVILSLSRHRICFVKMIGTVTAFITRDEIQHPFVRMWLFGIITLFEMQIVQLIERFWPEESWTALLSKNRLAKAHNLFEERLRRNQHCTLLACLQFSDKIQVLIENEAILEDLGFQSKRVAKRMCKEFESLRNNLAHAQDIVTHDFAQIARLAMRIESGRHS